MKISGSILDIKEKTEKEILQFSKCGITYLHLDVMDGIFVERDNFSFEYIYPLVKNIDIPYDIHLMVSNVCEYISKFKILKPEFITFHYEACNVKENIDFLKKENIKVGLAINPNTVIEEIIPYMEDIDLILIMSVYPGLGGQQFLTTSLDKIKKLKKIREEKKYNFLIEVDGGINDTNINKLTDADIVVVGSYLTKGNYSDNYNKLINNVK